MTAGTGVAHPVVRLAECPRAGACQDPRVQADASHNRWLCQQCDAPRATYTSWRMRRRTGAPLLLPYAHLARYVGLPDAPPLPVSLRRSAPGIVFFSYPPPALVHSLQ